MSATVTVPLPLLQRVRTASPCPVRWDQMSGDERTRHCAQCDLKVHNISKMTTPEAEAFLAAQFDENGASLEHRVCALIFRRADGTIITADCPVGVAAVRAAARRAALRVAAALGLTALVASAAAAVQNAEGARWFTRQPFAAVARIAGRQAVRYGGVAGGIILLPHSPQSKVQP